MIELLLHLWRWIAGLFGWIRPDEAVGVYRAVACEDEPDRLEHRRVYLLGDLGSPWCASLICPCGCDEIIRLSLLSDDRPHWSASLSSAGLVTLHPSIWRVRGCRSHFFLRGGRVIWSGPDTSVPVMLTPTSNRKVDRQA